MPKIAYIAKRFNRSSLLIIEKANQIINEYQQQGFTLTLRQLYYQFVARDFLPNQQKEYKRLGAVINDARLAGLIDWYAIEDRTRGMRSNAHFDSPVDVVEAAARQYHKDLWVGQKYRPEVWIEKDALIGVVAGVCRELDVPYYACRGYTSQSEQWRAGQRGQSHLDNNQTLVILHLGDHDPSGIDMSRDNRERMELFLDGSVELKRLALNMDQVRKYNPPPNPAKQTDSRFNVYIKKFGNKCWELDALEPSVMVKMIRKEVLALRDDDLFEQAQADQELEREQLLKASTNWPKVVKFLNKPKRQRKSRKK